LAGMLRDFKLTVYISLSRFPTESLVEKQEQAQIDYSQMIKVI